MIELIILTALMFGPRHGYEIKKTVADININNNTLYPLLNRLEDKEMISSTKVVQEGKPSKKVYSITQKGKDRLYFLLRDFDDKKALNNDEFFYRVAFFQFLDQDSIKVILDAREKALQNDITRANAMSLLNDMPDKSYDILFLHRYVSSQRKENLSFVYSLRKKYGVD